MSLKEVKGKIKSVKKIHQVTKAMEAVSAVKMRRSQHSAIEARPFALHALGVLRRLVARGVAHEHPLVVPHAELPKNALIIVVTSDRGLAGGLNHYVYKKVMELMETYVWTKERVLILAIGRKGYEHYEAGGYKVLDHVEHWGEGVAFGDPDAMGREVIRQYQDGVYDTVMIVYNNFVSTFSQCVLAQRVLPISFEVLEEVITGIVPERGKFSELREEVLVDGADEYTYEPNPSAVLDTLLPYLVGVLLYHAVLEANASEHSARMVAMKGASDRASDLTRSLTRTCNRERQTHITAEVSEITSGIEAMQ